MASTSIAPTISRFSDIKAYYRSGLLNGCRHEVRRCGMLGATLVAANQTTFDNSVELPDVVFTHVRAPATYAEFDLGGGTFWGGPLRKGLMTIYPSGETRTYIAGDHQVLSIAVPASTLAQYFEECGFSELPFTYESVIDNRCAVALAEAMWLASVRNGPATNLYFDGLAMQFLAVLADQSALSPLGEARPEDARIARAIDYAEAHLGEALTVAEIAAAACLSPGHFARCFKATTGEPVWTYVQRRRGERAQELLLTTHLPVVEIAYVCGFANQSHLTACFKQQFGVTPVQARREALVRPSSTSNAHR